MNEKRVRMGATMLLMMMIVVPRALAYVHAKSPEIERPVHFYMLLDRSGSMQNIRSDIVGGLNSYVSSQKEDEGVSGDSIMTIVQFDSHDQHEVLLDAEPIKDIPEFTHSDFVPRGGTPLNDAIGEIISRAETRAKDKSHPEEIIVMIILTDGKENDSTTHTRQSISKVIRDKEDTHGWTFVFLGANIDAFEESEGLNIKRGNTQNFHPDSTGVRSAFSALSKASSNLKKTIAELPRGAAVRTISSGYFDASSNDAQDDFISRYIGK